mmetsp:Transcript_19545/g.58604  ORF Transcript_19545/g.58604 Transcript_19545/m.58604 type:complete len:265 (+) Transcript_19545:535-1329(+)
MSLSMHAWHHAVGGLGVGSADHRCLHHLLGLRGVHAALDRSPARHRPLSPVGGSPDLLLVQDVDAELLQLLADLVRRGEVAALPGLLALDDERVDLQVRGAALAAVADDAAALPRLRPPHLVLVEDLDTHGLQLVPEAVGLGEVLGGARLLACLDQRLDLHLGGRQLGARHLAAGEWDGLPQRQALGGRASLDLVEGGDAPATTIGRLPRLRLVKKGDPGGVEAVAEGVRHRPVLGEPRLLALDNEVVDVLIARQSSGGSPRRA